MVREEVGLAGEAIEGLEGTGDVTIEPKKAADVAIALARAVPWRLSA